MPRTFEGIRGVLLRGLCCYAPFGLDERKPKPIRDMKILRKQIDALKRVDVGCLKKEFQSIAEKLPNYDDDPITVALFPEDDKNTAVKEKQNGVVGTSLFGNILIQINPLAADYEKWIPYVFAHEYHHTVWGNYWYVFHAGELENRLIESLVSDGEAGGYDRA